MSSVAMPCERRDGAQRSCHRPKCRSVAWAVLMATKRMSRDVEVFQIISVVPEEDECAIPLRVRRRRSEVDELAHRRLAAATTAEWMGPPASSPPIALEHVVLPEALDLRLVVLREPGSERARNYRLLRHRLLALSDPRVVVVTSARPGEGKTTCAINLALALAEDAMTRVLLVDANLRRPALGRILHFAPAESLVENITRFTNVGPPYPIVSVSGTRLHIAVLPDVPLEAGRLDRTLFGLVLHDLRHAYDYIVIDAAAVLESGDVDVVGECSSGVLVAARAGHTRKDDLQRAIAELAPAPVLGTVLIDA
jgi:Mrp family chromosome partitioning ATPase